MRGRLQIIVALGIAGMIVSGYALWQHQAPLGSGFCNIGATVSCDIVNKSAYAEVLGIPVALLGILGYAVLASFAIVALREVAPSLHLRKCLAGLAVVELAFSLYLTSIELFVLGAICIVCVVSQFLIIAIAGLAGSLVASQRS